MKTPRIKHLIKPFLQFFSIVLTLVSCTNTNPKINKLNLSSLSQSSQSNQINQIIIGNAILSGTPSDPSNTSSLKINVSGNNVNYYKFKVGPSSIIDCTDPKLYSDLLPLNTQIQSSLSNFSDGKLKLCVLGSSTNDSMDSSLDSVSVFEWTKDTLKPTLSFSGVNPQINLSNMNQYTVNGSCNEEGASITLNAKNPFTTMTSSTSVLSSLKLAVKSFALSFFSTAPICSNGNWSSTLDLSNLADGTVLITADITDKAGNPAQQAALTLNKKTTIDILATQLKFKTQPVDGYAGIAMQQEIEIHVLDDNNNLITSGSYVISLSLSQNPNHANLNPLSLSASTINGIARFSNLFINIPGSNYSLTASSPNLNSAISNPFKILSTPMTWGSNSQDQLGQSKLYGNLDFSKIPFLGSTLDQGDSLKLSFIQISAGKFHSCGIEKQGNIYCWGENSSGELGNNSLPQSATPLIVIFPDNSGFSSPALKVSAGSSHTCALDSNGKAFCWGDNENGELGSGDRILPYKPVPVLGENFFSSISAGGNHTCGVTKSNKILCWGDNSFGQLGKGDMGLETSSASPIEIQLPIENTSAPTYTSVSSGRDHTCALDNTQVSYCWGQNDSGQLGINNLTDQPLPTPVSSSEQFTQISAGRKFTCAINNSKKGYCWGNNDFGQLGNNSTGNISKKPSLLDGNLMLSQISTGGRHACALNLSNKPYCWGDNLSGQLGNNNITDHSATPVPVSKPQLPQSYYWMLLDIQLNQISAGGFHTLGLF